MSQQQKNDVQLDPSQQLGRPLTSGVRTNAGRGEGGKGGGGYGRHSGREGQGRDRARQSQPGPPSQPISFGTGVPQMSGSVQLPRPQPDGTHRPPSFAQAAAAASAIPNGARQGGAPSHFPASSSPATPTLVIGGSAKPVQGTGRSSLQFGTVEFEKLSDNKFMSPNRPAGQEESRRAREEQAQHLGQQAPFHDKSHRYQNNSNHASKPVPVQQQQYVQNRGNHPPGQQGKREHQQRLTPPSSQHLGMQQQFSPPQPGLQQAYPQQYSMAVPAQYMQAANFPPPYFPNTAYAPYPQQAYAPQPSGYGYVPPKQPAQALPARPSRRLAIINPDSMKEVELPEQSAGASGSKPAAQAAKGPAGVATQAEAQAHPPATPQQRPPGPAALVQAAAQAQRGGGSAAPPPQEHVPARAGGQAGLPGVSQPAAATSRGPAAPGATPAAPSAPSQQPQQARPRAEAPEAPAGQAGEPKAADAVTSKAAPAAAQAAAPAAVPSQPKAAPSAPAAAVPAPQMERKLSFLSAVKTDPEQKRREEEAKKKADEEAKAAADAAAKAAAEAEARRKAAEEAKRREAEEAKLKEAAEAKRKAEEEEAKRREAEEAKRREEEAAAAAAAEAKRLAEEEAAAAKKKAAEEEEARRKAEEEAARKKAAEEEEVKKKAAEEEAKRKAEEEEAARKKKAAEEAEQARRKAEEEQAKQRAEQEAAAKHKADEEARHKAEEEEKRRAEEAAAAKAEEAARQKRAQEEAARQAEAAAKAKLEEDQQKEKAAQQEKAAETSVQSFPLTELSDNEVEERPSGSSGLSAKAKRKAALQKANAQEKGDLLDAYTTPKQAEAAQAVAAPPAARPQEVAREKPAEVEEDDADDTWEDKEIGDRVGVVAAPRPQGSRLEYTRDFLMNLAEAHKETPEGLEQGEYIRDGRGGPERQDSVGPPRRGRSAALDRSDSGRWSQAGGGRGGPPPGVAPPGISAGGRIGGPMGAAPGAGGRGGGGPRGGIEGDQWKRTTPLPAQAGGRGGGRPTLHKTDSAFKFGQLQTEDPEEEKKQKAIKGLLNKLTPDNFDKLFKQIEDVKIDNPVTLRGLINQVFDKALTETTFCELYAELCSRLNAEGFLPKFMDPEDETGQRELTFRRILLNKCQEEFEAGSAAIHAVAKREKEAQDKEQSGEKPDLEEGEIPGSDSAEARLEARRADKAAADAELVARRRMLGNIQFIGQLFRKKMLTAAIMHQCIVTLLGEVDNPKREDVECLAKLMATVGALLETSKGREKMEVYFNRITTLGRSSKLESRLRFMLQDLIELRSNRWAVRREVEGPKKIADVHREAQEQLQRQRSADIRSRGSERRGPPDSFSRQSSLRPPPPPRHDDRIDVPIRVMQRTPSQDVLGPTGFRPGGAPARTERPSAAARGGPRQPSPARPVTPPEEKPARPVPEEAPAMRPSESQQDLAAASSRGAGSSGAAEELSAEETEKRAQSLMREFFGLRDRKELEIGLEELAEAKPDWAGVVKAWVRGAFSEKRDAQKFLPDLLTAAAELAPKQVTPAVLEKGLQAALNELEEDAVDAPKAPELVGEALGDLVVAGALKLDAMAQHVLAAGDGEQAEGEDGSLVDSGFAVGVVAAALQRISSKQGAGAMVKLWEAAGLSLMAFLPQADRENTKELDKVIAKYGLQALQPGASFEEQLAEALGKGEAAEAITKLVETHAGAAPAKDPALAKTLVLALLRAAVPNAAEVALDQPLALVADEAKGYKKLLQHFLTSSSAAVQLGAVFGAQQFFADSSTRKGLMTRILKDLHESGILSETTYTRWKDDNRDSTPGKIPAIMDANQYLQDLAAQQDEGEDE